MAKVGNWGRYLKFAVSSDRVLTFDNFRLDSAVRTSKHNMVGAKPKLEFDGPDLDTVSMEIKLSALKGVRPRDIEKKLRGHIRRGAVAPLVEGGRAILRRAMLTKISESYGIVVRGGRVAEITVQATWTEYR